MKCRAAFITDRDWPDDGAPEAGQTPFSVALIRKTPRHKIDRMALWITRELGRRGHILVVEDQH